MGYTGNEPGLDRGFRPSIAIAIMLGVMAFLFYHYRGPVIHVVWITFTLCLAVVAVCVITYCVVLIFGWNRNPTADAPAVRRASEERVTPVADMAATAEALADPDTDLLAAPGELPSFSREPDSTSGPAALPSAEPDAGL